MVQLSAEPAVDRITGFLDHIGIRWSCVSLSEVEFLPGIRIKDGVLQFDTTCLAWPGDLLHEAGHIAITPPSRRSSLGGKLEVSPAEEMAVLAWSFAAAIACGIDPLVVFHEGGYKHGGAHLAAQYALRPSSRWSGRAHAAVVWDDARLSTHGALASPNGGCRLIHR